MRKGDWIQTYTGRQFWPLDPRPEEVCIEDIAHALSLQCRFTGHCREFYSVAQHSVLSTFIVPEEFAIYALLHDAAEAYIADVSRPVKRVPQMDFYLGAEARILATVLQAFGLPPLTARAMERVKLADDQMLATEKRDLMSASPAKWECIERVEPLKRWVFCPIVPWSPKVGEMAFLRRFRELLPSQAHERAADRASR